MKDKQTKYEEAVQRNLRNSPANIEKYAFKNTMPEVKASLGIRWNDTRFDEDPRLLALLEYRHHTCKNCGFKFNADKSNGLCPQCGQAV